MENEIWKPVVGWEGLYEVSHLGRVRSIERTVTYLREGQERNRIFPSRVLSPQRKRSGYLTVVLTKPAQKPTYVMVHILVLRAFRGAKEPGQEARHLNGVRHDCILTNLKWGTKKENMADRDAHGKTRRGERHGMAKLTAKDVRDIRNASGPHGYKSKLARHYGVGTTAIYDIIERRLWKSVP